MNAISIPDSSRRWDCLSLGEVMLRLDPGEGRIHTTRYFHVWEGGGEYNVARGLRRCFGLRTAIATILADNPVGRLVEDFILQGGVDTALLKWVPYDGVGRTVRNGLNFTERGFGVRGAVGCSDRGHTAISQVKSGDFDWDTIFSPGNASGARWFHTGGIFAALSGSTAEVAAEAMDAARRHGTPISYDLNYRDSLWKSIGGKAKAQEVNRDIVRKVDLLLGNEEDFSAMLGVKIKGVSEDFAELPIAGYEEMLREVADLYPNLKLVASTLRTAHTATRNAWGAIALYQGQIVHVPQREVDIFDRVGGGDSFASGLIYGLLAGKDIDWAVRCGVAHGALAMTTPGDTSMATLAEVERMIKGGSARIAR
jgi:2-dehydro-3-deoxygluconokinase